MNVTVDTNVLVRAALADDPLQSPAAIRALRAAALIAVPTPALCEFVWVLSRGYRYPPADIDRSIRDLLATSTVVADRRAVQAGLAFMAAGADFADGVVAHEGRRLGADVFLSFDRDAVAVAGKLGIDAAAP